MRIATVKIQNFRCIRHAELKFDEVTTFIGPNGAGKSTVLHALDWFFNGKDPLLDEDVWAGAPEDDRVVKVSVTFNDLTVSDRQELGDRYAPAGADVFNAARVWDGSSDKFTGRAIAFTPFESVRAASGAKAKKEAWGQVRQTFPDVVIPAWTTVDGVNSAMDLWERQHPKLLSSAMVSDTHFFWISRQEQVVRHLRLCLGDG